MSSKYLHTKALLSDAQLKRIKGAFKTEGVPLTLQLSFEDIQALWDLEDESVGNVTLCFTHRQSKQVGQLYHEGIGGKFAFSPSQLQAMAKANGTIYQASTVSLADRKAQVAADKLAKVKADKEAKAKADKDAKQKAEEDAQADISDNISDVDIDIVDAEEEEPAPRIPATKPVRKPPAKPTRK